MKLSFDPGRGGVLVLMKLSCIHSFCVGKQGEMGVSVNPGCDMTLSFADI